jgi:tripartite-type tricarboxylate transporter receptor subunit TctC
MRFIILSAILLISQVSVASCVLDQSVQILKACKSNLKLLVGVTPGGASDIFARELSKFAKQFDINLPVINKTGASGNIASAELLKNDGSDCKFMMGTAASLYLNKFNNQLNPQIDPESDYTPIGLVATNPMFLAVNKKKIEAKTVDEFIAKTSENAPFFSTPGIGSSNHLMALKLDTALKRQSGYSTHIPTKGASEALIMLQSGEIEFVLDNPSTLKTTFGNSDIQIIANTSKTERIINGIKVPPLSSSAKLSGIEGYSAFGLVANKHIAQSAAIAMENLLSCLVAGKEFKTSFSSQGYDVQGGHAQELKALTNEQLEYWKPVAESIFKQGAQNGQTAKPAAAAR